MQLIIRCLCGRDVIISFDQLTGRTNPCCPNCGCPLKGLL